METQKNEKNQNNSLLRKKLKEVLELAKKIEHITRKSKEYGDGNKT